ncbi:hypothetical protein [Bradyrhizobium sp. CCBAU 53421]|uniref:hypothetical protein n=1 Tax=Bradyrhizobium sp. CCBAU 53421 TaxID=1325120 RepID=UPI00188B1905|nr:hypothetical protein [Bradyrhizobium sp. CCBAU 53421]QOZ36571.1 hypothetical protein XH92_37405 [Bradyrhizobium sp. CCBAU 53421]
MTPIIVIGIIIARSSTANSSTSTTSFAIGAAGVADGPAAAGLADPAREPAYLILGADCGA